MTTNDIFSRSKTGSFLLAFFIALVIPRAINEALIPLSTQPTSELIHDTKALDPNTPAKKSDPRNNYSDNFMSFIFIIAILCFMLATIQSLYPLNYGFLLAGALSLISHYSSVIHSLRVLIKPHFLFLLIILILLLYEAYRNNKTSE